MTKMNDMQPITIEYDKANGFVIRQGDKYADWMCWDEMMGLLTELTMPKDFSRVKSWMKTEEQHRKSWRHRDDKPKETKLIEMKDENNRS